MRQLKREVKIGNVTIGGKNPIAVQTMLNVPVEDIEGNVAQAKRCEAAGCQILRVTCPSAADAKCIEAVKNAVNIPIVADIHFDYKAAIACADVGVDKIRINPGNIGSDDTKTGKRPNQRIEHANLLKTRHLGTVIVDENRAQRQKPRWAKCRTGRCRSD